MRGDRDQLLIDEWVFAPQSIRVRPPGRLLAAVLGVLAVALVGITVVRSGGTPASERTEVLGVSEQAAHRYLIDAAVLFEIADRHEDGSTIVLMTVERVLTEQAPALGSGTLRLGVGPDGTLGSVTGLAEGLALDPSTSASALVGDLRDGAAGHSWTAQVRLSLVSS